MYKREIEKDREAGKRREKKTIERGRKRKK
jgi:hypothetical protein